MKETLHEVGIKKIEKEHCRNQNYTYNMFN